VDSLVQVPTKADARLWLQRLLDEADQEEAAGIIMAIRHSLAFKYHLDVIGSVACSAESSCIRTGVCQVANEGQKTVEGLKARIERSVRLDLEQEFAAKADEFVERVTRTRLREADLEKYSETDVVTTVLPMCSVCWDIGSLHLDHIVPKSKGGLNDYTNYQLLCGPCNASKNDRDMDDWHQWVNTSEDERASRIRERRAKNRKITLPKGEQ
jgi:5-methylcytosine-specific restriction endonuclease McrA